MKNIAVIFIVLSFLVTACNDNTSYYRLSGCVGNGGDTLYLYGLDRRYDRTDTLIADEKGRFECEIPADTIFPLNLLMPSGELVTLYAEPNLSATVFQDTLRPGEWSVKGGRQQFLLDSMTVLLDDIVNEKRRVEKIDSFIKDNPLCEAGIMLIRRFLTESRSPSVRDIENTMNSLGGKLQDNDYIVSFKENMGNNTKRRNLVYTALPVFKYMTSDSVEITNTSYKGKYLIITFWASWDEKSRKHLLRVSELSERFDSTKLGILNLSLDYDTLQWKQAIIADSLNGEQVCDLKMWNTPLCKRYNVNRLPYSILVNPQLLTVAFDVSAERMENEMDSLISEYEAKREKEKRATLRKMK